jgi:hypothetical protein
VLASRDPQEPGRPQPEIAVEETIVSVLSTRGAKLADVDAARLEQLRSSGKAEGLPDSVGVLVEANYSDSYSSTQMLS